MDIIKKHFREIFATFFMAVVVITAFFMLKDTEFQEWTFGFTLLFSLAAFALMSSNGAGLVLKLWQLELRISEVKETEASVKEITRDLLDIIKTQSEHSLVMEAHDDNLLDVKIEKLLKTVS